MSSVSYRMYCRVFQFAVRIANRFVGYRTPEILEGEGCVAKLPFVIRERGVGNVMVVSGPHILGSGLMDGLLKALDGAGVAYRVFSDIQANPTDENVEAGLKVFRECGCRGIIAFGGGSPMDCAKAIAARVARPGKTVAELQGLMKVRRRTVPLWAVPTTAGTGSETTVAAVITIAETRRKASISDSSLIPDMAVLDPSLTVGLSPSVTAATGMDALCHAVESYVNWTYCTRLERDLAIRAVRLIHDNLREAHAHPENITARRNMQLAAFYAGRSFTRGCVGYAHACGHPLSALYGLPHGTVMAVLLPRVMRRFGSAAYGRLSELADACGIGGGSVGEKALSFVSWIEETNVATGLPEGFPEISDADIPKMAEWAAHEANPLYPVPVIWSRRDFRELYAEVRAAGKIV